MAGLVFLVQSLVPQREPARDRLIFQLALSFDRDATELIPRLASFEMDLAIKHSKYTSGVVVQRTVGLFTKM